MIDHTIIQDIKNGNESKLTVVYKAYRDEFISWAVRNYQCPEETAKDIYQVVIVIFYENIMSGKLVSLQSSVKTYIFAIGKNKLFEYQASLRKQSNFQEAFIREPVEESFTEEKEEVYAMLETALQELGEPCKTLLVLSYYKNYSTEEIASALNYKSTDSAKTQKYKCLVRLKKIVQKQTSPNLGFS